MDSLQTWPSGFQAPMHRHSMLAGTWACPCYDVHGEQLMHGNLQELHYLSITSLVCYMWKCMSHVGS